MNKIFAASALSGLLCSAALSEAAVFIRFDSAVANPNNDGFTWTYQVSLAGNDMKYPPANRPVTASNPYDCFVIFDVPGVRANSVVFSQNPALSTPQNTVTFQTALQAFGPLSDKMTPPETAIPNVVVSLVSGSVITAANGAETPLGTLSFVSNFGGNLITPNGKYGYQAIKKSNNTDFYGIDNVPIPIDNSFYIPEPTAMATLLPVAALAFRRRRD
jgi:hypothetical protein